MKDHSKNSDVMRRYKHFSIGALIILLTIIVYWQVGSHEFINFDDDIYVYENAHVKNGITIEGVKWSFSLPEEKRHAYWHPITWISHMLDVQLYGLHSGFHHLTNLFLHVLNSILLFFMLYKMTSDLWKCAFVAALFALHPINVDSVAWLAERKNVLSSFFWMITITAYIYYAERPDIKKYLLMCILFVSGLLAKPMIITLPFVLLLLDYWPLGRIRFFFGKEKSMVNTTKNVTVYRLIMEKVPLLILSLGSVYTVTFSLRHIENITINGSTTIYLRLQNALVSYIKYIWKMLFPRDFTIFYPYPEFISFWKVLGAIAVILLITFLALNYSRKYAFFIVGWFWYLGTLVPVLGLIQSGLWPEIADRWAYIPLIGLYIVIAWGVPALLPEIRYKDSILKLLGFGVIVSLMILTKVQVGYWRNNFTLYEHALKINTENFVAHGNLGYAFHEQGEIDKAIMHYEKSLRINPQLASIQTKLGSAYNKKGRIEDAIERLNVALIIDPDFIKAHNELASLLLDQGFIDEAIDHFLKVQNIMPHRKESYQNLAAAYLKKGKQDETIKNLSEVLRIDPNDSEAYNHLGTIYLIQGDLEGAVSNFINSLRIEPSNPQVHYNLGIAFIRQDRMNEAIKELSRAIEIDPSFEKAKSEHKSVLDKINRINSTIKKLEEKLAGKYDDVDVLHQLATLQSMKGEYQRALEYLWMAKELRPDDPKIYFNIACIYSKQNEIDNSIYWLKKSIEMGFSDFDLLVNDSDLENIRATEYYKGLTTDGEVYQP